MALLHIQLIFLIICCTNINIISTKSCNVGLTSKYGLSTESQLTRAKVLRVVDENGGSFEVEAAKFNEENDEFDFENTLTISSFRNTRQCRSQIHPGKVYLFRLRVTQHSGKFLSVTDPESIHLRTKRKTVDAVTNKEGLFGEHLKLKCHLPGKITWLKDGEDILTKANKVRSKFRHEHIKVNKSGNVLTFRSLSEINNGEYTCQSTQDNSEKKFNVTVLQCSTDEDKCDSNSLCSDDNGLCCKSESSSNERCICLSPWTGYRCNQKIYTSKVYNVGLGENKSKAKTLPLSMIIGITSFTVLILGSLLVLFIYTKKDGEENEEQDTLGCNYDDSTIETLT